MSNFIPITLSHYLKSISSFINIPEFKSISFEFLILQKNDDPIPSLRFHTVDNTLTLDDILVHHPLIIQKYCIVTFSLISDLYESHEKSQFTYSDYLKHLEFSPPKPITPFLDVLQERIKQHQITSKNMIKIK